MSELLQAVVGWPALIAALLVFGLLPGLCLRLIVLLYPKESDARRELIGELYHVSRWERPFWVAEQLETAVFEGLIQRPGVRYGSDAAWRAAQLVAVILQFVVVFSTGFLGLASAIGCSLVAVLCGWSVPLCTLGGALVVDLVVAVIAGAAAWRDATYDDDDPVEAAVGMAWFGGLMAATATVAVSVLDPRARTRRFER